MTRTKKSSKAPLSRSMRIYQKLAIFFVLTSFVALLFVLYLSISSATIKITPNKQVVSTQATVEVVPEVISDGQISGYVVAKTFVKSRSFTLPSEGATPQEAKAGGMVTLINETNNDQILVATTRLLSEEGVLFRLDNQVTIPANGQIEAMVHADQPGAAGNIGPTQFTIPGLSESLQKVIYAVSVDDMTGGVVYIRTLTEEDLNRAVQELSDEMLDEAAESLADGIDRKVFDGEIYDFQVVKQVSDTEPGTETGVFNIELTAEITGVFYNKETLQNYMENRLKSSVADGLQVVNITDDGVQLEIRSVDSAAGKAIIVATLEGDAIIALNNEALDKTRITGRSASEAITLLESSDLINKVRVSFTPFWLKRIPTLSDHIKIVIQQ
ncbi:hypothetical protein D6827_02425 [Candidatus Parcubacteria bacterium]|nr:MAG: hypothetical protein D6827_02425 [Candidatus Parcubacteria bacterium]